MRILYNANIYTMDPAQPRAQAVAIANGKFLMVGANQAVLETYQGLARPENLNGAALIPGLTDAHLHLHQYALALLKIDCETTTRQECLARLAAKAETTPAGEWILGHGWNQNSWEEGFGSAALLDQVTPNHPVYLTAKSLHAGWANTLALQHAGINRNTPDPLNGRIERDANGEPTGILFETAMLLVSQKIVPASQEQITRAIQNAQGSLLRLGLTGVHDFDQKPSFVALQTLEMENNLQLRVVKTIPVALLDTAIEMGLRSGFGSDHLRIGMVKAFADGALGPRTAAMLLPYENEPENRGVLMLDGEEIFEFGRKAAANGLGLTIHAIGDQANHEVLNGYQSLREYETQQNLPALRHRLEHAQVLHPQDIARIKALDVVASMQPIHAISDMEAADRYWGERARYGYAWKSLLDLGTAMAFGSDAPVDSPNPFWGLHAAVCRKKRSDLAENPAWYPEQRVSRQAALAGYTTGTAFAGYQESDLGQIKTGYLADLLVLDRDYFTCPEEEIHQILPQRVMVGGNWVVG